MLCVFRWTYEACFDVTVGIRQIHKELHLQPQSFTTTNADGSTTTVSVMSPTPAAAGGTSGTKALLLEYYPLVVFLSFWYVATMLV